MAKFSLDNLPKEQRIQMIAEFYDTIDSLKSREEVRLFFRDLLTPDEIAMLMRRIEVAVLLKSNFTYEGISELLGVGKAKVTNVQKTLARHGQGYEIAIKRLLELRKSKLKNRKEQDKIQRSEFRQLKRKYPTAFLLFNLIDEVGDLVTQEETILSTPSAKKNRTTD